MASPIEHFVMLMTIEWYYEGVRDAIVVMTTTKAYTIYHLGRLDATTEFPPALAPANLLEFLQRLSALPEYELMPEFEPRPEPDPILVYDPLLEFEPMSPNLPPLEPIVLEVPVIEISSSDSPTLTSEPLSTSNLFELDPSEAASIAASRVSQCNSRHGRALALAGYIPQSFPMGMVIGDVIIDFISKKFSGKIDFL